ncbi:hypothetical protein AB0E10_08245 [Streptomyces sp. NPDC048045]|uniref:hypothetical protein n=1 Tax=Streptomyces sp. NPDC048045 TaxID=3154710 RepID=UPI00341414E7
MPLTTAPQGRPNVSGLTPQEREVLYALGRGLGDAETADALALPGQLGRILVKLRLRDRAVAIVHAFDCALVVPGHGPRREATARGQCPSVDGPAPAPWLRSSALGPLRAPLAGRPVDVGPLRQQAVPTAPALTPGRSVSRQELLNGVRGMESPAEHASAGAVPPAGRCSPHLMRIGARTGYCPPVAGRERRRAHGWTSTTTG